VLAKLTRCFGRVHRGTWRNRRKLWPVDPFPIAVAAGTAGVDPKTQAPDVGTVIDGLDYDEIISKSHDYPAKLFAEIDGARDALPRWIARMLEETSMKISIAAAALGALLLCAPAVADTVPTDAALVAAAHGTLRSPANVARDRYRHPGESLSFWELRPRMTVLEIWPSGGFWTEILAPYAKATGGSYIAALSDAKYPLPPRFADKAVYGDIATTIFNKDSGPLAPPGTVDLILTARNLHDWMWTPGMAEKSMVDFFAALKPGGILAIEEHRADPRPMTKDATDGKEAKDGYVSTAYVVALAQHAGFKLDAQSEINANPKDTKDHPFGVWTLPPSRQSAPSGQPPNPAFDHTKYDAIGESDRMTLRFRKPG
jgi:predicted methyltransferase